MLPRKQRTESGESDTGESHETYVGDLDLGEEESLADRFKNMADDGDIDVLTLVNAVSRETIEDALGYAARGGHSKVVRGLLPHCNKPNCGDALRVAAEGGYVKCVWEFLAAGVYDHLPYPASIPVTKDNTQCIRVMLPYLDDYVADGLLRKAAMVGNVSALKLLLPSTYQENNEKALWSAAYANQLDAVKALIPHVDSIEKRTNALRIAAERGHVACVEALIPVSDAKSRCRFDHNIPITSAFFAKHVEIVKMLAPHSYPPLAEECLRRIEEGDLSWRPLESYADE